MAKTRITVVTSIVAIVIIAAGLAKMILFPPVSDKYFQTDPAQLEQVPAGLVVLRPTHFGSSGQTPKPMDQIVSATVDGSQRIVGVNMNFNILMSVAYGEKPARIGLPTDAPTNSFDFLVTAPGDPLQHLQTAIRQNLGYVAHTETNITPVLALKIANPELPGLKPTPDYERQGMSFQNGRIYFTHMHLIDVAGGLEQIFKVPLVDETGLTNFYDLSLPWGVQMQRQMQDGTLDKNIGEKIVGEWGLKLVPESLPVGTLVVEKQ